MIRNLTIIAAASFVAAPAHAYTHITNNGVNAHWPGNAAVLWLDSSVRVGGGDQAAFADAVSAWNKTPVPFRISLANSTSAASYGNGRSEIQWIDHKSDLGDHPAATFSHYSSTGVLDEADIKFALDWGFTDSELKSQLKNYSTVSKRSLRGVAMHEIGHFLGLGHEADVYNVMGDDSDHAHVNDGTTVKFYPGEDATSGLRSIYGTAAGRHDLAVSHWRWVGTSGEYSAHGRTRIFDTAGTALPVSTVDSEPFYQLTRGTGYALEHAREPR